MTGILHSVVHVPRRKPLAACVASLFALCAPAVASAATWTIDSCDGDASAGDIATKTGTLRFAVSFASDGDTVDLSGLSCPNSKISLMTGGRVVVLQPSLKLRGSAASVLTIDGSMLPNGYVDYSGVLYHAGNGTLTIQDLGLSGGQVNHQYIDAKGGCIYSKGNVLLDHASISSCSAHSVYEKARGGGVYTKGNVEANDSTISGNLAGAGTNANGGGVYAKGNLALHFSTLSGNKADGKFSGGGGAQASGDFFAAYSTVSDNRAYGFSYGGGLELNGTINTISASTISGNASEGGAGGIDVASRGAAGGTFQISNSTISGNYAVDFTGGMRVDSRTARFYNSTIAFNTSQYGGQAQATGVQLNLDFNSMSVTLESTLISNNTHQSNEDDLGAFFPPGASVTINGGLVGVAANNLIRATSIVGLPSDTRSDCPLLGQLRDNGGLTKTHALLSHSPAIDAGNDFFLVPYEQRGAALINGTMDYLRVSGPIGNLNPKPDIGAHEVQQDDVVFNTAFEGCD